MLLKDNLPSFVVDYVLPGVPLKLDAVGAGVDGNGFGFLGNVKGRGGPILLYLQQALDGLQLCVGAHLYAKDVGRTHSQSKIHALALSCCAPKDNAIVHLFKRGHLLHVFVFLWLQLPLKLGSRGRC